MVWNAVTDGKALVSHAVGVRDHIPLYATVPAGWTSVRIADSTGMPGASGPRGMIMPGGTPAPAAPGTPGTLPGAGASPFAGTVPGSGVPQDSGEASGTRHRPGARRRTRCSGRPEDRVRTLADGDAAAGSSRLSTRTPEEDGAMRFLPTAQAVSVFMVVLFLAYLTTILVPYAIRKPDPPGDASG